MAGRFLEGFPFGPWFQNTWSIAVKKIQSGLSRRKMYLLDTNIIVTKSLFFWWDSGWKICCYPDRTWKRRHGEVIQSQKHFSHRAHLPLLKLRQDRQRTRRKADWKVKSFFLTESAEHAEKGGFKRQKIFSQSTRSRRRKVDWKSKIKSIIARFRTRYLRVSVAEFILRMYK